MAKPLTQRLAEYRQRRTTDLSDKHVERLIKSLQDLETQVVIEARKIPLKKQISARTTIALAIRPKLKQLIEQTYLTTIQTNISEYDDIASWLVGSFKQYPIPNEFKQITQLDLKVIQQLKRLQFAQFEDVGNEFANELANKIYSSSITGSSEAELIQDIRGTINGIYQSSDNEEAQELVNFIANNPGDSANVKTAVSRLQTIYGRDRLGNNFRRYAKQLVQDSLMGFDSQFAKYRAEEIGLKHFRYAGTLERDSRPFCRKHVNKIYSEKDIERIWKSPRTWQGAAQGDPFVVRGGYNCRHTWQPVNPEWNLD